MSELKECPFCGGEAFIDEDTQLAVCKKCDSCSYVKDWNNRIFSQWINVEDELPELEKLVLVHGGIAKYVNHSGGKWITMTGYDSGRLIRWKVTHWMPLPEPPEETE